MITSQPRLSTVTDSPIAELKEIKANRNITLMVVSTVTLSIVFLLPRNIYFIYKYLIVNQTVFIYSYITISLYNLANGLNTFIYYFCNKMFRKVLCGFFKRIKFHSYKCWNLNYLKIYLLKTFLLN